MCVCAVQGNARIRHQLRTFAAAGMDKLALFLRAERDPSAADSNGIGHRQEDGRGRMMGNGKRDVGADNPGRADSSDSDASSDSDSSDGSSADDTSAQPPARKYHALDMDMSVREALSGCTIIEYPVIEVALPRHRALYTVVPRRVVASAPRTGEQSKSNAVGEQPAHGATSGACGGGGGGGGGGSAVAAVSTADASAVRNGDAGGSTPQAATAQAGSSGVAPAEHAGA